MEILKTRFFVFGIVMFVLVLQGCDNSLDPLEENKGRYSIYGALNIDKEVNYIRVKDLNIPIGKDSAESFSGTVTLEDLNTGNVEQLERTTAVFDSVVTHNFKATMDITPATDYRVAVEAPDGKVVSKIAHTPTIADYMITTNIDTTDPHLNIDDFCVADYTVTFEPIQPGEGIIADIGFEMNGNEVWLEDEVITAFPKNTSAQLVINPQKVIDEAANPDGDPLDLPTIKICRQELTSHVFTVRYQHLGLSFVDRSTSDSLNIPFGTGQLVGMYENTFSFDIDTTR